jgi:cytochrome bd ubiquinol oxidase subunit II
MSMEVLQVLWYLVFLIVVAGYIALDGFDLGVGILHPFARKELERRVFLNAIGPVWDGNEVWLVIIIGGLFAGFPHAYATLMSAFYVPVMAFIAGLILRAVAIEFRSKNRSPTWRSIWDWVFAIGSLVITLGLGFVLGNLIAGIPIDGNFEFTGNLASLITPYTIFASIFVVSLCAMHGCIYLVMKTEGELHDNLRKWANRCIIFFIIMYVAMTATTLIYLPHMVEQFREMPWLFVVPLINILAVANIPREMSKGHDGFAFISSIVSICLLVALYAIGTFPILVRASNDPALLSLTISNSYASKKTLQVLLTIVIIGVPLALAYIITIYYLFRGKVKLDSSSY